MSLIAEYQKTLDGLILLLEKKKQLKREKRFDVEVLADLNRHISVIQSEIYEVQDVLLTLERKKGNDGNVRFGYRPRGDRCL